MTVVCPKSNLPGEHRHMLSVRCPDCTAAALVGRSLAEVESWWQQGLISNDALAGYRHVWATSAVRSSGYDSWTAIPVSDQAKRVAATLRRFLT